MPTPRKPATRKLVKKERDCRLAAPFHRRKVDAAGTSDRRWHLLAHLACPERLNGEGMAEEKSRVESETNHSHLAPLAKAILERSYKEERMRPLLYTCVVCEHFYHCGASCFPRVMLQRATLPGALRGPLRRRLDVTSSQTCTHATSTARRKSTFVGSCTRP